MAKAQEMEETPITINESDFEVSLDEASDEDLNEALALLKKKRVRKAKEDAGLVKKTSWADLSPEQKEKARAKERRRQAEIQIYKQKAIAAGITVSDADIDAYLKEKGKL